MILKVKILKLAIHKKCINIQHFSKENNTIYQLTLTFTTQFFKHVNSSSKDYIFSLKFRLILNVFVFEDR